MWTCIVKIIMKYLLIKSNYEAQHLLLAGCDACRGSDRPLRCMHSPVMTGSMIVMVSFVSNRFLITFSNWWRNTSLVNLKFTSFKQSILRNGPSWFLDSLSQASVSWSVSSYFVSVDCSLVQTSSGTYVVACSTCVWKVQNALIML